MAYSKIHVQYADGSKARGARVVLGFSGLLGGMTKTVYSDTHGEALVQHSSSGNAIIYVNGNECGKMSAPGETVVFLR